MNNNVGLYAENIGYGLRKCVHLNNLYLDLSNNKVGNNAASGIGKGLSECINLKSLNIYLNNN